MQDGNFADIQARHLMQCWSSQRNYQPLPVKETSGCWITTTDGRRIFDLRSAHECINLGFNHPKVLAAMKKQMESVVYVTDDFATAPTAELVQTLARLAPGGPDKKVFLSQSGAAAVEAALKGARFYMYNKVLKDGVKVDAPMQYPYPYKIISRYRSWHGSGAGAASVSGDPRRWFHEPLTVPGVVFAPEANPYRPLFGGNGGDAVEGNLNYLDYLIEQEGGSNKVAAMILEPVVGSNGIIVPPRGYLEGVRALCDKWGILLIVDETMTGMGRTGRMFAIEHFDVVPDIIVMGKALGVYCPLAATIFSEKVSRSFDDNIFGHGQSFSGHALGCAAAVESIRVLLHDGVLENCVKMGEYLGKRLSELAGKHRSVGEVRGMGLFWTLELVRDRKTREPLRRVTEKYSETIVKQVADYLLREKNIYVPTDKFGAWVVPPLIVTREEIDFIVDSIDEALKLADDWVDAAEKAGA